jgi:hypothetical protein
MNEERLGSAPPGHMVSVHALCSPAEVPSAIFQILCVTLIRSLFQKRKIASSYWMT